MKNLIRDKGFTLVSAIFILVILSLVGSFIVKVSTLTQRSQNLAILGTRAFFAAKSGIQWGIFKVTDGSGPYNCPASPTIMNLTQGTAAGFTVEVSCAQNSFTERGKNYNVFIITALGRFGASTDLDYVSRRLFVRVVQPGV